MARRQIVLVSDILANNSDKLFTNNTNNQTWLIHSIRVELTATATAGTRILQIDVQDTSNDVVLSLGSDTTRIASGSQTWEFVRGGQANLVHVSGAITESLPDVFVMPGFDLRVFDSSATAAAADDMVVHIVMESV